MPTLDFENGTIGQPITAVAPITTVVGSATYVAGLRRGVGANLTTTACLHCAASGNVSGRFYWRTNYDPSASSIRIFIFKDTWNAWKSALLAVGSTNLFSLTDGATASYATPGSWTVNTTYRFEFKYTDEVSVDWRCFLGDNTAYEWEVLGVPTSADTALTRLTFGGEQQAGSNDHTYDDAYWTSGLSWVGPKTGLYYYNGSTEVGTKSSYYNGTTEIYVPMSEISSVEEPPPPPDPVWTANGIPPEGETLFGGAAANLSAFETTLGETLGIYRSYWQSNQQSSMVSRATADIAAGRIPWISTKLPYSWALMASGSGDAWAQDLADRLGVLGGPVWIALHHEPEGDGTTADWVALQRRMAPIFKARSNIAYSIILMGWGQWGASPPTQPMDTWWPGSDYVDILAFDPYNWYDTTNSGGSKTYTWAELKATYYDDIVAWLAANSPNTKWAVAETGYTDTAAALPQGAISTRGTGADWLTRAYDDMKAMNGVALAYFNVSAAVNNEPTDWTWPVESDPKIATYRAILQRADRWPG